ncbi:hypothetical protein KY289_026080 [Solanum tuberosum]|nr:hypothetical protein KY289_026080 [Solanum tuberosum]
MVLPRSNEETIHLSLVNAASFISIKLCGESNYIPWKTQIVCLLQSHDLLKFIDGTIQEDEEDEPEEEKGNEEDYNLQRKRNDELVKACIFGSLSDQLLKDKAVHELDTARQVWLVLEQRYSPKPKLQGGSRVVYIELKDYSFYFPLFRALLSRDWDKAEAFLKQEKDASIAPINTQLQTALHLAVGVKSEKGNKHFVEKLVASIENKEDLARKDCFGETALHYAARFGNLDAAEIIVKRNPRLPHIACMYGTYPIHYAASYGYVSVDVFAYFLRVTEDPAPYTNLSGVKLLYALVYSDLYVSALGEIKNWEGNLLLPSLGDGLQEERLMGMGASESSEDANNMWDKTVDCIREVGKEVLGVSMVTFGVHDEGDGGRIEKLKAKWKQSRLLMQSW